MKSLLHSRGILMLSLLALFGSGLFIGRMTAPSARPAAAPVSAALSADVDSWVAGASRGLVNELKLDEAQQQKVRTRLEPVARAIFTDRERALFQMHLRLLELHDTLAADGSLSDGQLNHLQASRSKLRDLIIRTFPRLVRENPSLAIGEKNQ